MMPIPDLLPDSHPYSDEPVKNELLLHAAAIAANRSRAQNKLSGEALRTRLSGCCNHIISPFFPLPST